jgi:hypothetical protein
VRRYVQVVVAVQVAVAAQLHPSHWPAGPFGLRFKVLPVEVTPAAHASLKGYTEPELPSRRALHIMIMIMVSINTMLSSTLEAHCQS